MQITLLTDDSVRLEQTDGPLTIEAPTAQQQYSPFHMLASGLAFCTHSVLTSWATHARINPDDLAIEVRWEFVEKPHRIGIISMTLDWPSLPETRRKAAERAASLCAIHATLTHPPEMRVAVVRGVAGAEPAATEARP